MIIHRDYYLNKPYYNSYGVYIIVLYDFLLKDINFDF